MSNRVQSNWIRFSRVSLRSFFVVSTALCVAIGWYVLRAQAQHTNTLEILSQGGGVIYDYQCTNAAINPQAALPGPAFIRNSLGIDYVSSVVVVDLNSQKFDQMPDLSGFPSLRSLWLFHSDVDDLGFISSFGELENLAIQQTDVSSLEPVSRNRKLKWINIADTNVSDLSPLFGLPNLKTLTLTSANISAEELNRFRTAQPDCEIIFNQ